jgi:methionyl-tRNA synthetase
MESPAPQREYLLLPSHPTPNGPLHLGHIAGPYLRLDVLRRVLQRRGDRAVVMFPFDVFDSYVLLKAHQDNKSPGEIVEQVSAEILEDLKVMDIGVDAVVNPLSPEWSQAYAAAVMDVVERLRARSALELRRETFIYSPKAKRFIVGCWLLGKCPNCYRDSGGYSCEGCGAHYRPEEIGAPHPRLPEAQTKTVAVRTLFFSMKDDAELVVWVKKNLPPDFRDIILQQLKRAGACLRITVPGTWGVPYDVDGQKIPQVVFPGFASLGLMLACGREYKKDHGRCDPFDLGSGITTVCSFGIDNTVTRVLSCVGGPLAMKDCRLPDHFLLNHFYRLEGKKFSTSRKHAIWVKEVPIMPPNTSDIVRFYLLKTAPENGESDFSRTDFDNLANEFVTEWNPAVAEALTAIPLESPPPVPEALFTALTEALRLQENHLDLEDFHVREIPLQLRQWVQSRNKWRRDDTYWWLKGLALLCWPILPKLSSFLWDYLGGEGNPENSKYTLRTRPRTGLTPPFMFHSVSGLSFGMYADG